MANRPKGYGFSREVADKMNAKYSDDDEMEVVSWISTVTEDSGPTGSGKSVRLCLLFLFSNYDPLRKSVNFLFR